MKSVRMLYGHEGMDLRVPDSAVMLEGQHVPALPDPDRAVLTALENPIASPPLRDVVASKRPRSVAITISDITRPVPNRQFLPGILRVLNECGLADCDIVIIIGTGLHRPSTPQEHEILLGNEILRRIQVIDHNAQDPASLVQITAGSGDDPPISVCRRFARADFRIVTGYIEPHFMAGFSGGRKGLCPALVDLKTVQRFHGYRTLADPNADMGILDANPCHRISLKVARTVGVDFLFNVAITRDRRIAGIYCGDLEAAHLAGCKQVGQWTSASVDEPFDLVVTNGGGFPLDQTFYQTTKGMVTALPALGPSSTLLQVSHCGQGIGSQSYADIMLEYNNDWRRFLTDIAARTEVKLDQWQFQMHARTLERIGVQRLWFVTDRLPMDIQKRLSVTPIDGPGDGRQRAQRAIDGFVRQHPDARIAVIADGPYTMLRRHS